MGQTARRARAQSFSKLGLANVAAALLTALSVTTPASALARGLSDQPEAVSLSLLPLQAQQTQRLILAGGPFPYAKDGTVFGNRERRLPNRPRGHYREYTVPTPGVSHRGPRRIVCGGQQPTAPEACYYSGDHYTSFQRIVQ